MIDLASPPDLDPITPEIFQHFVGRWPFQDDLDRCNCPKQGEEGHWSCGWNHEVNLPIFITGRKPNGKLE